MQRFFVTRKPMFFSCPSFSIVATKNECIHRSADWTFNTQKRYSLAVNHTPTKETERYMQCKIIDIQSQLRNHKCIMHTHTQSDGPKSHRVFVGLINPIPNFYRPPRFALKWLLKICTTLEMRRYTTLPNINDGFDYTNIYRV